MTATPLASRPTRTVVSASLVAGIALWFSRAALDVAGSGTAQQRVAALPSWPELPAWIVLMLLAAAAIAFALPSAARTDTSPRRLSWDPPLADAFRPLVALAVLALPYLPWLPDWIPALRLLAGPLKWLVWAVVLGQVAWILVPLLVRRGRGASVRALGARAGWVAIFAASLVLYGAVATRLAGTDLFPDGDEPHYLIITQSLLYDRDLRIANNHERGDYQQYYVHGALKPDYRATGADGEIYSIHPVGLPVLVAPAFALGGYRAVVWLLIVLAAATAALMWRWALVLTGSAGAATFAWAAVGLSAPFVFSSTTVYPEIPAAFCVMAAAGLLLPKAGEARGGAVGGRTWLAAVALAALPWLSTKYVGMALAVGAVLAWRLGRPWRAGQLLLPLAVSLIAWLAFFSLFWGTPLPSAPYGNDVQMSLWTLLSGGPGIWLDQEFGVLTYAPVLVFGFTGLAGMWRERSMRLLAVELAFIVSAMWAMVGSFAIWWGGSSMPGREAVSLLPLLAGPIAWQYRRAVTHSGRAAAMRLLLLVSLVITVTLTFAVGGQLLGQERDGASAWLEWLSPVWHLWASAPTYIFSSPLAASAQALVWIAGAFVVAALCRRSALADAERGRAARYATMAVAVVSVVVVSVVPALPGTAALTRFDPEARWFFPMLDRFDAVARPIVVRYDPVSIVPPAAIPPLFALAAVPGQRTAPQPLSVMFNARFALPAGEYELELTGSSGGQGLPEGEVGLQIGREGPPLRTWPSATPGDRLWRRRFRLPLDAEFVGFRATPEVEHAVGMLRLRPLAVVDAGRRSRAGSILSAVSFGAAAVFLHDSNAYAEADGFWVKGESTAETTFMKEREDAGDLVLNLHTGANSNRVTISTPFWAEQVDLVPYMTRTIVVPSRPGDRFVSVQITSRSSFVPADVEPGSSDTRRLGCWVAMASTPA